MEIRHNQPRIGTRKLHYLLKDEIKVGRDRLFKILRKEGLLIKKRRKYTKTTNSQHWMRTYKDSSQSISLKEPEQLWVSDITYLSSKSDTLYLHLITDAYSKKIMGYKLSKDLRSESTLEALEMAISKRSYNEKSILHHSDRGLQYCSNIYVSKLKKNNFEISMTESGSPYDNAVAERVNGILKEEFYLDEKFEDFYQAQKHVEESIMIYNNQRPHISCSMLTPVQMHQQNKIILRKWNKKLLVKTRS